MMKPEYAIVSEVLESDRGAITKEWLAEVRSAIGAGGASVQTTTADADKVLRTFREGLVDGGDGATLDGPAWAPLRNVLEDISSSGAAQGVSAAQTSAFVLALKKPLFSALQVRLAGDPSGLTSAIWSISTLVDRLSQHTLTTYQKSREEVINRQQQELLELSTPVVKLWDGVLAVPMIGTLDSSRTQLVMESLLQRIVDTGSELAIIDITGVPTVDTLVAQHLLKTVTAIRLMGADCIISGVRPQIAQTIVHLGIDLQGITTKASLADALALALKRGGYVVSRVKA
jgi:rsbT co-antagonist protein RsbR